MTTQATPKKTAGKTRGFVKVREDECKGCGCCVAECPGKAIELKHFTDEQIVAKTAALFAKKKGEAA